MRPPGDLSNAISCAGSSGGAATPFHLCRYGQLQTGFFDDLIWHISANQGALYRTVETRYEASNQYACEGDSGGPLN
jgi:hypothetical protein